MIYTITALLVRPECIDYTGGPRCFGYFETLQDAKRAVRENQGSMHECLYSHLVIEEVEPGIGANTTKEWWYKWSRHDDGWNKCKKPSEFQSVYGFGLS